MCPFNVGNSCCLKSLRSYLYFVSPDPSLNPSAQPVVPAAPALEAPGSTRPASGPTSGELSAAEVLRIAKLARLEVPEDQVDEYRKRLTAVFDYVSTLTALDVSGVTPLTTPAIEFSQLRKDVTGIVPADSALPSHTLSHTPYHLPTSILTDMAPASEGPFVRVPKVVE